jgi:hypothetical protein
VTRDDDPSRTASAEELAASLATRVRQVLAAAEESAAAIRARAGEDAEERAREIRHAAEQDAERLLRRVEREAADYLEDARRRVDAFAAGRARRISAIADRLLAHADALAARAERADRAGRLHRGIDEVVDALAAAAEAVAAEARRDAIALPRAGEPTADVTRLTTRPHAVPDLAPGRPPVAAAPDPPAEEDDARAHVREIANTLPRRPGVPKRPPPVIVPPPEPPDVVA